MMPLAPMSSEFPSAHKPKIGFSIDSIVGGYEANKQKSDHSSVKKLCQKPRNFSPKELFKISQSPEPYCADDFTHRLPVASKEQITANEEDHNHHLFGKEIRSDRSNLTSKYNNIDETPSSTAFVNRARKVQLGRVSESAGEIGTTTNDFDDRNSSAERNSKSTPTQDINDGSSESSVASSSSRSQSPCILQTDRNQKPSTSNSPFPRPIGIHAVPINHHGNPLPPPPRLIPGVFPPPHSLSSCFTPFSSGMMNFVVAAAAARRSSHIQAGLQGWMQPPHPIFHHSHPATRAQTLNPWLLAKHEKIFPNRFGPGHDLPGFLLQPFRKPKRIRTAFSPTQLLKLEHVFERNHYVVGAERKQLAASLSLSETQIKVWFQNRRTKHKRTEQEEESVKTSGDRSADIGSNQTISAISADSSTRSYVDEISDDEKQVMDDEYSDDELEPMQN